MSTKNFFPFFDKNLDKIYLDHATSAPIFSELLNELHLYYSTFNFSTGKSSFLESKTQEIFYQKNRAFIANYFNILDDSLFFFPSSTYIAHRLIHSFSKTYKKWFLLFDSHNAITGPLLKLQKNNSVELHWGNIEHKLTSQSISDYIINQLKDKKPHICIIPHVSHNMGYKLDIELISTYCKINNIICLIDGTQAVATYQPYDLKKIDGYFFSAYKMHGPQNLACLYLNSQFHKLFNLENEYKSIFQTGTKAFELGSSYAHLVYLLTKTIEWRDRLLKNIYGNDYWTTYNNDLIKKKENYKVEIQSYDKNIILIENFINEDSNHILSFYKPTIHANDLGEKLYEEKKWMIRSGFLCADYLHQETKIPGLCRISLGLLNI
jgi:selenocysteine lyase/cysteine desulfurase